MTLAEIMAAMSAANDKVQALAAVEAAGTELTAEQQAELDGLYAEFEKLEKQKARVEQAERMAAATAKPVAQPTYHAEPRRVEKLDKQEACALMIRSVIEGGKNPQRMAEFADAHGAPELAAVLNTGTTTKGGFIIPPGYSADFIELLRPNTVVRKHTTSLPMPSGSITLPKQAGKSSASYIAEGDDIGVTEPAFGQVTLAAKKMAAIVPVSNDLIRFSSPQVNAIIRDDLLRSVAEREDLAFLRDDGTGNVPKGLLSIATGGNKPAAAAGVAPNAQVTDTELGKLELALMSQNVSLLGAYWVMSPRTFQYLENLRDGNGNKVYPEIAAMRLRGKAIELTTQIPENLGAGTNESEIYLYQPKHGIIGDAVGVTLDVSSEATYNDGGLVSAYSRDETVVRVICEHDFAMRHDAAVAVLTAVQWGA